MALYQRGSKWYIKLPSPVPGGKPYRKATGTADKALATKLHREAEEAIRRGRLGLPVKGPDLTLAEAHRKVWQLRWRHGRDPKAMGPAYAQWAKVLGADRPLRSIAQADVVGAMESWAAAGNSPRTIVRKATYLRALLRACEDLLGMEGLPRIRWRLPKAQPAKVAVLSREDESRVLQHLEATGESLLAQGVVVLVETGLRLGELMRLRAQDVDWDRGVLTVTESKSSKPRSVPLSDRAADALSAVRRANCAQDGPLFRQAWETEWAWKLDRMRKVLFPGYRPRLDPRLSIHSLRHTCATRLLQSGVPQHLVVRWLGHSGTEMTDLYTHLDVSDLQEALLRTRQDVPTLEPAEPLGEGVSGAAAPWRALFDGLDEVLDDPDVGCGSPG